MHRHNSLGPGGYCGFQTVRIQAQGLVNLCKNRHGTGLDYGFKCGHKGKRRNNDLVSGPDAAGCKGRTKGCCPAGTQMAEPGACYLSQFFFKFQGFKMAVSGPFKSVPE